MNLLFKEYIELKEPAKSYLARNRKENADYSWLEKKGLHIRLSIDKSVCTIFLRISKPYSIAATSELQRLRVSFPSGSYTPEQMRSRLSYCESNSHLGKALNEISDEAAKIIEGKF